MTEDGAGVTDDGRRVTEDGPPSPASSPESPRPQSPVTGPATYKFQSLQVYQLALDYLDEVYDLAHHLPDVEKFNLKSQIERAATSVALNIAEGSTGQSDPEQGRFVSMAVRSYLETVACLDIAERRGYLATGDQQSVRDSGHQLFVKLLGLRRSLSNRSPVPGPPSS